MQIMKIMQISTACQSPFVAIHHGDQRAIKRTGSSVCHGGEGEEQKDPAIPDCIRFEHKSARLDAWRPYEYQVLPVCSMEQLFWKRIAVNPLYPRVL